MVSGSWSNALTEYTTAMRAAGRSRETIKLRGSQLRRMAVALRVGPWEVTTADLLAWIGGRTWSRETLRSHRAAARSFYGWALGAGHVDKSPAAALPTVRPSPPSPRPTPDLVYRRALERAVGWERLALRLGDEAGLRRGEMVLVHERDLVEDLVGVSLRVHGKGAKEREVPLNASLALALARACRDGDGWAFPGNVAGHLSPAHLAKRVSALMPDGVTTHSLRHRFATRTYEAVGKIEVVQDLLGHASADTTRRYVRMGRDELRRAVEAIAA